MTAGPRLRIGARAPASALSVRSALAAAVSLAALAAWPAGALAQGTGAYAQRYAEQCASCHGPRGTSEMALVPHLGGQPSFYAITQLFLFREGRRNDHPMAQAMSALAKGMNDTDLRGFSDHIATLPPPAGGGAGPRDAARFARGQALANKHHCTGCHGGDLAGGRQVPRVGGQREDYLLIALKGFRSGVRLGYTNAMGEALAGLGEADLDDLAHFMAHAGPAGAASPSAPASGGGR